MRQRRAKPDISVWYEATMGILSFRATRNPASPNKRGIHEMDDAQVGRL